MEDHQQLHIHLLRINVPVLVGNVSSAVKNQSIKGWHSCYIHAASAFIFTWISLWLMDSTAVQRKLEFRFGKLGTKNKDHFLLQGVVQ